MAKDEENKDETEDQPADEAEAEAAPKGNGAAAPDAQVAPASPAAHAADHDHGFGHVVSVKLLGIVLASLLVLTVLTVTVTKVDLGGQLNLVVAMVIATIKAGLVVTFFMHLLWDKKFNLLVFLTGVLFVILFIGLALADRIEYQHLIDQHEQAAAAAQQ